MLSVLAVDSGNSFLKWSYFINNQRIFYNKIHNQDIENLPEEWDSLKQPDVIIVAHVASNTIYNKLSSFFDIWNTRPIWVTATSGQCGVTNNYENPGQLGSDRWAALIAAWNKYHESCLVINVGTAMTVDALSNQGVFLGGIIVPSSYILLNSIQSNTQIDLCHKDNYRYEVFPINTVNAIYSGVIHSCVGSIERIMRLFNLQQGYAVKNCIVSGGGVADLLPYIDFNHTVIDNVVLDGLLILAKDIQSNNM
ncbi:MAG: type III pantothenate kinase [Burkholderiales bacterium]|nr:type III pantothenate kinase [Burkholderiales bacterium]MDR4517818.1 type III pantothenate kinase [Nitrosomonas sp.]